MASEGVVDWDEPLSSSSSVEIEEEEERVFEDQMRDQKNLEKLTRYVKNMAYKPSAPPCVPPRIDQIASPKKLNIVGTYKDHGEVMSPKLRGQRVKRIVGKYNAISTEQLEKIIKNEKLNESKKEDLIKRKQDIYFEMLTKMEQQARTQYLNVLVRKFASFIANLATRMEIPPQLVEPYSRMQRGIFCNILLAMGMEPENENAIYYTTPEALKYEVCHKLAHAFLSLIIKALDSASTMDPDDIVPQEADYEMDKYIKDRLMCAAEKKILKARNQAKANRAKSTPNLLKKCGNFFNTENSH